MRMRSGVVVLALVALGASACGQADQTAQTAPGGSVAPLTLPAPKGTVVEDKVGQSLGGRITPAATADYLSQVAAQTKQVNTGQFRLVTAVTGGTGHEGQTTTLTELSGAFDRDAGRSRVELDASGANAAGGSGLSALVTGPIGLIIIGSTGYLRMPDLFGTGAGTWMKTEDPDQGDTRIRPAVRAGAPAAVRGGQRGGLRDEVRPGTRVDRWRLVGHRR